MSTHTRMTTWWHGLFFAINLNIFLLFIYFSVSTTTEEIRMDHFTLSLSIYHFFFCDFPAFRYWTCSKNPIKKKKMYKNGTIIITIKKNGPFAIIAVCVVLQREMCCWNVRCWYIHDVGTHTNLSVLCGTFPIFFSLLSFVFLSRRPR